jgi:hypothetical protein
MYHKNRIESLYDLITGDEDARVCKDIPESACNDQPYNFFVYLGANLLSKVADELASARLVLPWLLASLGTPAAFIGFLVPIREAGVLLPQLVVAAYIRSLKLRKWVWVSGAGLSGLALVVIALVGASLEGVIAGWVIVAALILFSLARGLCSVSAKDVLGKTVSKSRRGRLMGLASGMAGLATLAIGLYLEFFAKGMDGSHAAVGLVFLAAVIWIPAMGIFATIREVPGATSGGGNALREAVQSLSILKSDPDFRRYVIARIWLLSVALAAPFYVLLAEARTGQGLTGLGMLIIAGAVAGSVSAPLWGWMGDRSSRVVMASASAIAGVLGIATWIVEDSPLLEHGLTHALIFLILNVAHSGVRLGRKVYLVDLGTQQNRASMVAVSNTVIGVAMLGVGLIGVLADFVGIADLILLLGILSFIAAGVAWRMPDVSH